jgi:hypothetical protein
MIRTSELKVGDVFYTYEETNNFHHRRKTHRVIDGEDWFKYNAPLRTYKLITCEVLGILRKELEGEWKNGDEYELETEFFIQSTSDTYMEKNTGALDEEDEYFLDKEEALSYIKTLEERAKELDKT